MTYVVDQYRLVLFLLVYLCHIKITLVFSFFLENRDSPQLLKKAYNGFTEGLLGIPVYKGRTANGIEYLGKPKEKKKTSYIKASSGGRLFSLSRNSSIQHLTCPSSFCRLYWSSLRKRTFHHCKKALILKRISEGTLGNFPSIALLLRTVHNPHITVVSRKSFRL